MNCCVSFLDDSYSLYRPNRLVDDVLPETSRRGRLHLAQQYFRRQSLADADASKLRALVSDRISLLPDSTNESLQKLASVPADLLPPRAVRSSLHLPFFRLVEGEAVPLQVQVTHAGPSMDRQFLVIVVTRAILTYKIHWSNRPPCSSIEPSTYLPVAKAVERPSATADVS
ncbi:hypothetical protein EVAR_44196_1 [Eumeta japonica]|uniref:Uncharacterized protein n=1 Tax=Eumeta variegata TaxID=151549 RepID=A0A4C1W057_EUMVA|nr:hypothetical protein EVAR_44196_1 [Eumeta japonica]